MCGITGYLGKSFNRDHLLAGATAIRHRGPDADGYFVDDNTGIGLGHRRLSILDLSAASNQPFYSQDGRYVMVYNGEVYNFKEIAHKYSIHTKTTSDSEVIIEAFSKVGLACLDDLNGMFAIAIWDKQEEQLYLIRDRIGIKPLYYAFTGTDLVFGSEIKAITAFPLSLTVDRQSISNFLYLGYIPDNRTIYQQIKKLRQGTYLVANKQGVTEHSWWSVQKIAERNQVKSEAEYTRELGELVESAVNYNLISDVPLGVFLSGGVDSSLLAAVAQSQSNTSVNTFSIGFEDKKYNESAYAQQVANHIGATHHMFVVKEQDAVEMVSQLMDIYDEPYADSSAIPTLLVSKLARQKVTVALSGDGGDELFMGYGFYYWARRLQQPAIRAFRHPAALLLGTFGDDRIKRASHLFEYPDMATRKSHIFSQEQYYFMAKELKRLLVDPIPPAFPETVQVAGRPLSWAEEQSFFDMDNYLPDQLLIKTDRASMHHSLEVRVPLLDHRLIEFAVNLPEEYKLREQTGKYLLKQVLYKYYPKAFFDRPKWGFAVPIAKWLKQDLRFLIDTYLSKESVESCQLVHYKEVQRLLQQYDKGLNHLYARIWALVLLHKWIKEHKLG